MTDSSEQVAATELGALVLELYTHPAFEAVWELLDVKAVELSSGSAREECGA